jgi:hypothetical protein
MFWRNGGNARDFETDTPRRTFRQAWIAYGCTLGKLFYQPNILAE